MSKFTVTRNSLLECLTVAGKAIGQNPIVPALANYLFRVTGGILEVCGSNSEIFISKSCPCDSQYIGSLQLPAGRMQFIKDLADQPLIFEVGELSVTIKASSGKYTIPYEKGEDYPLMKMDGGKSFAVPGIDIYEGISKTLFAVHPDGNIPFSGVRLELGKTGAKFVATNISFFSMIEFDGKYPEHELLLSPRLLTILSGMPLDGDISVTVSKSNTHFELPGQVSITAILMDMKYPVYSHIIAKDNDKTLTVNRAEFIGSLKRTVQFSNDAIKTVSLSMGDVISVSARNPLSEEAEEVVPGDYVGEQLALNINGNFLIQCLSKLDGDTVALTFSTAKRAVIFGEEKHTMLVMPYQL